MHKRAIKAGDSNRIGGAEAHTGGVSIHSPAAGITTALF